MGILVENDNFKSMVVGFKIVKMAQNCTCSCFSCISKDKDVRWNCLKYLCLNWDLYCKCLTDHMEYWHLSGALQLTNQKESKANLVLFLFRSVIFSANCTYCKWRSKAIMALLMQPSQIFY